MPSREDDLQFVRNYENDKEIERKLIVSSWHDLDRWWRISSLHPTDFQDPLCELAFVAMQAVVRESQTIDMIRVLYFLRSSEKRQAHEAAEVLSAYELAESHKWATDGEFSALLRHVKKIACQMRFCRLCDRLKAFASRVDVSVGQIQQRAAIEMEQCFSGYSDSQLGVTVQDGLTMLAEELALLEADPSAVGRTVPLGFRELHRLVPGLWPGCVLGVMGRASMGKSAFVLQLCRNVALHAKVLLVSLEVEVMDVCRRLTAQIVGKPAKQLKSSEVISVRDFEQMNLIIDKPRYKNFSGFKQHIKMMKMAHEDLFAVAIDYVQQLASKDPGPQADLSTAMKAFALQERLAVIEALQVDLAVDNRKDTRPDSSDIRWCKTYEQDADILLALWRPGFPKYNKDGTADLGEAWCYVRKNRDGECGEVPLRWNGATTSFTDCKDPLTQEQIDRINQAARQGYLGDDVPEKMF